MSEALSVSIVVALMLGFYKVFDYFTSKRIDSELSKLLERLTDISEETRDGVHKLVEQHAVADSDGIPVWYIPRRWAETQENILEILRQISTTQDKLTDIATNIDRKVEGCDYARKVRKASNT